MPRIAVMTSATWPAVVRPHAKSYTTNSIHVMVVRLDYNQYCKTRYSYHGGRRKGFVALRFSLKL